MASWLEKRGGGGGGGRRRARLATVLARDGLVRRLLLAVGLRLRRSAHSHIHARRLTHTRTLAQILILEAPFTCKQLSCANTPTGGGGLGDGRATTETASTGGSFSVEARFPRRREQQDIVRAGGGGARRGREKGRRGGMGQATELEARECHAAPAECRTAPSGERRVQPRSACLGLCVVMWKTRFISRLKTCAGAHEGSRMRAQEERHGEGRGEKDRGL
eukprot:6212166-Pleurochrysis_carterae.AAC.3